MPDNDQANNGKDGVLSDFSKEQKKSSVVVARAQKEAEEIQAKRRAMLARTSLTPFQAACLKDVPIKTIRQAWFTLAHLLLEPGAMVAVMGCGDGTFAYTLAVLNPDFHVIGLDQDRDQITDAKKTWQLTNLEFVISKVSKPSFPNNSLDAVVNSFSLHEIYSRQRYNDTHVREMLDNHFALLKPGGLLFLRDYAHPPPGEYVMIEFPDVESMGDHPTEMSEADLLVSFSAEARLSDSEGRGFFLEELEPYYEGTRLFRLPYKWAYEFILRKDNREKWEQELSKEYTVMTAREARKTLRRFEARLVYSAPHWDSAIIKNQYEGHFRLYDDEGVILGYPSTSHVFLARKVGDGESVSLQERRPSNEPTKHLTFNSMRNNVNGTIVDLVSRDVEFVEFLPYRIGDNGRLHIFLHEGMPRAITNAVPRSGKNIDGKMWSGHMIETIGIQREILAEYEEFWTAESTQDFSLRHLGLRPADKAIMEQGPEFYPSPTMIDERIETKFLNVEKSKKSLTPKWISQVSKSPSGAGKIREYDAQHVLNAITVGLIPNTRLEQQILALFSIMGLRADNWSDSPIYLEQADVKSTSFDDLLKIIKDDSKYFNKTTEYAGTIRSLHSYFVDEGFESGAIRGLSANDVEFVIEENKTVNTALVLPLIKDKNNEVLAGFVQTYLPVPGRYGKNQKSITAPSFNLPPEVKDMDGARAFVAKQFDVDQDKVMSLGESFFIHNGMTPQRIFPFCVTDNVAGSKGPTGTFTEYAPVAHLVAIIWHMFDMSMATIFTWALQRMHKDIDFGIDKNISMDMGQDANNYGGIPPFGLPIPSSMEEHNAIVGEYRNSMATAEEPKIPPQNLGDTTKENTKTVDINQPDILNNHNVQKSNVRKLQKVNRNVSAPNQELDLTGASSSKSSASGESSSGDSSGGGGGGMEKSGSENQENKQNTQQKKLSPNTRRFENIDYSSIDGDKPSEEKEKQKVKEGRKAPVVSILRPPPSRKVPSASSPLQPSIAPVDTSEAYYDMDGDDMDMDNNIDDSPSGGADIPTPER